VEPEGQSIAGRLETEILIAPAILEYEFVNVAITKLRSEKIQKHEADAAFFLFEAIDIQYFEIDALGVFDLAALSGLSACDASYLWLARQHNAELVSLDKGLNSAFLSDFGR